MAKRQAKASMKMKFPKAKGVFITATDTGIGKTLVAGGIARHLVRLGHRVGVFKPVASGCRMERQGLISSDAEFLAHYANVDYPLSVVNPVSFITPAAPVVCERFEARRVDFERIADCYRYIIAQSDVVIVEGIGGIRVPVSDDVDVLTMARHFGLPVVIVAGTQLGTINHTLLTIDALRSARLDIVGVVINGYAAQNPGPAQDTAAQVISRWGRVDIISILPFDQGSDVSKGQMAESVADTLGRFDWPARLKLRSIRNS